MTLVRLCLVPSQTTRLLERDLTTRMMKGRLPPLYKHPSTEFGRTHPEICGTSSDLVRLAPILVLGRGETSNKQILAEREKGTAGTNHTDAAVNSERTRVFAKSQNGAPCCVTAWEVFWGQRWPGSILEVKQRVSGDGSEVGSGVARTSLSDSDESVRHERDVA